MIPRRRIAFSHLMHMSGLFGLTVVFAVVALGISAFRFLDRQETLRIAVGPAHGVDARFVEALARRFEHDESGLRFVIVPTEGPAASARALESGRADLAVVRSDVATPTNGAVVVVLHADVALLATLSGAKEPEVGRLAGARVGIIPAAEPNSALLDTILAEYGVAPRAVERVLFSEEELARAISEKKIDALLIVSPLRGGTFESVAAALSLDRRGAALIPLDAAEGMAARNPAFRQTEIPAGLLPGSPPRPKESVTTVAVATRLEASRRLPDETVTRLAKQLFATRRSIHAAAPIAAAMEKPDAEKDSPAPAHPGAAAYYDNNEKSFMDLYGDWIYVGVMALSGLASGAAALLGVARSRARKAALALIDELVVLEEKAHAATDPHLLAELEAECENLSIRGLRFARDHNFDSAGLSALRLAIDEARRAIDDQRRELEQQTQRFARAAMTRTAPLETKAENPPSNGGAK